MADFADQLIAEMEGAPWPLPREADTQTLVSHRRALRRGDKLELKRMANWIRYNQGANTREYLVLPLAKMIARTFADFMFGEAPNYSLTDAAEDDALKGLTKENKFSSGVRRAARTSVSEGEVWWKIHVNAAIAEVPLIEWYSRLSVVPLFYGDRLLACAFITEVRRDKVAPDSGDEYEEVYRHAEIHCNGRVVNKLFKGTDDMLGRSQPLTADASTATLPDEWMHGLNMLAGRVVNDIDDDVTLGESDYDQIEDILLALNEALTISSENARLTGKDRVFVAGRLLEQDGSFNASLEVFQTEADGGVMGEDGAKPPIVAVEKKYDAVSLWTHIAKMKAEALGGVGIVVQLVGEEMTTGSAESGTAIRLRYLPTINATVGKAAEWHAALPTILCRAMEVAALPTSAGATPGGFGWTYGSGEEPAVELADPLPVDETELVNRLATTILAEIMSRRSGIAALHPDWTDEQIDEELALILQETQPSQAPSLPALA